MGGLVTCIKESGLYPESSGEPLRDSKQIKFRKILWQYCGEYVGKRIKTRGGKPTAAALEGGHSGLMLESSIQENTSFSFSSLALGFFCLAEPSEVMTFAFTSNFQQEYSDSAESLPLGVHISLQEYHDFVPCTQEVTFPQLFLSFFFSTPEKSLFIYCCEIFVFGQGLNSMNMCVCALQSSSRVAPLFLVSWMQANFKQRSFLAMLISTTHFSECPAH